MQSKYPLHTCRLSPCEQLSVACCPWVAATTAADTQMEANCPQSHAVAAMHSQCAFTCSRACYTAVQPRAAQCWCCRVTLDINAAANSAITQMGTAAIKANDAFTKQMASVPPAVKAVPWVSSLNSTVGPMLRNAASSAQGSSICPSSCLDLSFIASKQRRQSCQLLSLLP